MRMRTIKDAHMEIIKNDPGSALSYNYIRQLALSNKIITHRAGSKILINLDSLESFLNTQEPAIINEPTYGTIRRIEVGR